MRKHGLNRMSQSITKILVLTKSRPKQAQGALVVVPFQRLYHAPTKPTNIPSISCGGVELDIHHEWQCRQ